MKTINPIEGYLVRFPLVAAICYAAVVIAFLVTAWLYVSDFLERRQAVATTGDILSHLEGRNLHRPEVLTIPLLWPVRLSWKGQP